MLNFIFYIIVFNIAFLHLKYSNKHIAIIFKNIYLTTFFYKICKIALVEINSLSNEDLDLKILQSLKKTLKFALLEEIIRIKGIYKARLCAIPRKKSIIVRFSLSLTEVHSEKCKK